MVYSVIEVKNDWTVGGKSFKDPIEALVYLSVAIKKLHEENAQVLFHRYDQLIVSYPTDYAVLLKLNKNWQGEEDLYIEFHEDKFKGIEEVFKAKINSGYDEVTVFDLHEAKIIFNWKKKDRN